MRAAAPIRLRDARLESRGSTCDLFVSGGRVTSAQGRPEVATALLEGRCIVPGLVNAHDHLDLATLPFVGAPPYASARGWAADVEAASGTLRSALAVPLADRLLLGGLRNLLGGATAVAHHGLYHRSLGRPEFPVRVLSKYEFAVSPAVTPRLRDTYRTTDRRIPWFVHVAEGTDASSREELRRLEEHNVLRHNTVLVHAIGLEDADADRLAAAGASVVWCPESNRRLYSATAAVRRLLDAGVRVGLGSDSPLAGVRDPLSNLAAARREGVLDDQALLALAAAGSGEVARLPYGGVAPGDAADLLVVRSVEALLAGERTAVELTLVAGRPVYGTPELMRPLVPRCVPLVVDGAPRCLAPGFGRRVPGLLRRLKLTEPPTWLRGVTSPELAGSAP